MTDLILTAGFGFFPGAPINPTEQLMNELEALAMPGLRALVLPVAWGEAGERLLAAIARERPRHVLLFGLHARAARLRNEMLARNARAEGRADAAGRMPPAGPIDASAPDVLPACLPVERIEAGWAAAGIGFERSRDAGLYLCNETLFRLCRSAVGMGVRHFGFIHVPVTDELAGAYDAAARGLTTMPAARLLEAARIALRAFGEEGATA